MVGDRDMTFKRKIECSEVLAASFKKKSKKIKGKKNRLFGIIVSLAMILYLAITTFIKYKDIDKTTFFDSNFTKEEIILYISFVAIILKIIFSFINAFLKKSIFSLNHYIVYTTIDVLSSIDLFVILALNLYNGYYLLDIGSFWQDVIVLSDLIEYLFKSDIKRTLLLLATVIINIPVVIKLITYILRYWIVIFTSAISLPAFPILTFYYLIFDNNVFYEYSDYSEDYYVIKKRLIINIGYDWSTFMKRLAIILMVSLPTYLLWLLMEEAEMLTFIDEKYVLLVGIIPVGFLLNLVFYSKKLSNSKLNKSEIEIKSADIDEKIMKKIDKEDKIVVKEETREYSEDEIKFSDEE